MVWAAVGSAAASVVGSVISSNSAKSAANKEADAAKQAAATYQQNVQPYLTAGQTGIQNVAGEVAPGGLATQRFTMADATNSPAEQFAQQRASEATQNSAAAKGGLLGINTQRELQDQAAGIASQYQNQAYQQWNQQNQQEIAANQALGTVGANAATGNATTAANAANAAGGAQAGAQVAQGQAVGGGLSSIANILGQNPGIFTPTAGAGAPPITMGSDPNAMGGSFNNPSAYVAPPQQNFSDERLKENIQEVGKTHAGVPIYTYNMKRGGPKQMGVMAQELEQVNPGAVTKNHVGYRMVDYGMVK